MKRSRVPSLIVLCGLGLVCPVAVIRATSNVTVTAGTDMGMSPPAGGVVAAQTSTSGIQLAWSSLPGARYRIEAATNLAEGFFPVQTDIPSTPAMNRIEVGVVSNSCVFYRVIQE